MVAELHECLRGCVIAAVGIEGDESLPVSAVAEPGTLLCAKCIGRLGWHLGDAPDVAARARLALVPGVAASTGGGERVSGSREQSLPMNVTAMETCDLLVSQLGGWIVFWGAALGVRVPRALAAAASSGREVVGVTAGSTADSVAVTVEEWSLWLRVQMPGILAHAKAAEFHDGVVAAVRKGLQRFPRDEPRVVMQKPRYCPVCEQKRVQVTWQGPEPLVQCGECHWVFDTEWKELLDAIGVSAGGSSGRGVDSDASVLAG